MKNAHAIESRVQFVKRRAVCVMKNAIVNATLCPRKDHPVNADTLRKLASSWLGRDKIALDGISVPRCHGSHVARAECAAELVDIADQFAAALVEARLEEARLRPCNCDLMSGYICSREERIAELERQAASVKGDGK